MTPFEESKAFFNALSTPDGKVIMQVLERLTAGNLLRKPEKTVDPYATIYAVGQHDIVKSIKQRIEDGKMAR